MREGALILIIENESQMRRLLRVHLEARGYEVKEAVMAWEGLRFAITSHPDLIILERIVSDLDGLYVVKTIRSWSKVPLLILSNKTDEQDKITLLEAGADDYILKPFNIDELIARIHASLRRNYPGLTECVFHGGTLTIDFTRRTAVKNGISVHFTPVEMAILRLLARHQGMVLSPDEIIRELWGPIKTPYKSYLRVYMLHIRRKIEDDPSNPKLLLNERGLGYRLV
jgi:two-component system, OmpR family, KDP operon response regulator KdpE